MRSALTTGFVAMVVAALPAMAAVTVKKSEFGKMPNGSSVAMFTVTNAKGVEAKIITLGGILVSLKTPDRKGALGDVVLGHDSVADYLGDKGTYFGALIGRYANRIGGAQFKIGGATYKVPVNNGKNGLHGGNEGFNRRNWTAVEVAGGVELSYTSKDGEEGYPGTLKAVVTYTLSEDNRVAVHYTATTDKATVVNLTNHSYWNLKGEGDILANQVTIFADRYTPVDSGLIPTGELKPVEGTPFDFRHSMAVGARINQDETQLKLGKGYDHNWVLNKSGKGGIELAARVEDPPSGRILEVYTDQPGIQFYTGNFLDGSVKGKGGKPAKLRTALCLETQHYPDSPNKPAFPTTLLKPGEKYDTTTEFQFSAK